MDKCIYLCGFMGCGKTTVGKRLAKALDVPFLDLDSFIESKQGKTIPQIFEIEGEAAFREMERESLIVIKGKAPCVIAAGGGTFANPDNARLVKESGGVIVYLNVPFERCYERIKNDKNRPLVQSNTKEALLKLYIQRSALYGAAADITVSEKGIKDTINAILHKLDIDNKKTN